MQVACQCLHIHDYAKGFLVNMMRYKLLILTLYFCIFDSDNLVIFINMIVVIFFVLYFPILTDRITLIYNHKQPHSLSEVILLLHVSVGSFNSNSQFYSEVELVNFKCDS